MERIVVKNINNFIALDNELIFIDKNNELEFFSTYKKESLSFSVSHFYRIYSGSILLLDSINVIRAIVKEKEVDKDNIPFSDFSFAIFGNNDSRYLVYYKGKILDRSYGIIDFLSGNILWEIETLTGLEVIDNVAIEFGQTDLNVYDLQSGKVNWQYPLSNIENPKNETFETLGIYDNLLWFHLPARPTYCI